MTAITRIVSTAPLCLAMLAVLGACDGLNFNTARGRENEDRAPEPRRLIELDERDIRPPLDRSLDGVGEGLPLPGATRPLGPAPDLQQLERFVFTQSPDGNQQVTSYSLTFSNAELALLNQSGAVRANPAIRQALTPPPTGEGRSTPLNYTAEIQALAARGLRTSPR